MEDVPSGLKQTLSSFLSVNTYISLVTISVELPKDLSKTFILSSIGVLNSLIEYE